MNDTEDAEVYRCKIRGCSSRFPDDMEKVVGHYLSEHPKSELLEDVLLQIGFTVSCKRCDVEFTPELKESESGVIAHSFCPQCREEDGHRKLFFSGVEPSDIVNFEGAK